MLYDNHSFENIAHVNAKLLSTYPVHEPGNLDIFPSLQQTSICQHPQICCVNLGNDRSRLWTWLTKKKKSCQAERCQNSKIFSTVTMDLKNALTWNRNGRSMTDTTTRTKVPTNLKRRSKRKFVEWRGEGWYHSFRCRLSANWITSRRKTAVRYGEWTRWHIQH